MRNLICSLNRQLLAVSCLIQRLFDAFVLENLSILVANSSTNYRQLETCARCSCVKGWALDQYSTWRLQSLSKDTQMCIHKLRTKRNRMKQKILTCSCVKKFQCDLKTAHLGFSWKTDHTFRVNLRHSTWLVAPVKVNTISSFSSI